MKPKITRKMKQKQTQKKEKKSHGRPQFWSDIPHQEAQERGENNRNIFIKEATKKHSPKLA